MIKPAAGLLVATLLGACTPGGGILPERDSLDVPVSTKEVVAKQAPHTLIAEDASICAVVPERFERTQIGALVRCAWRAAA